MAIVFNCPNCQFPYRLKDELAGKRATCKNPDCRQVIVIPAAVTVPASDVGPSSKTAFISYRRASGAEVARLIRTELASRGWKVFLDVEDLAACNFDERLLLEIENSTNFIIILSQDCLDIIKPDDWLVKEIEHAISTKRCIVPIFMENFVFPPSANLPVGLRKLPTINGILYSHYYLSAVIERILKFLKSDN